MPTMSTVCVPGKPRRLNHEASNRCNREHTNTAECLGKPSKPVTARHGTGIQPSRNVKQSQNQLPSTTAGTSLPTNEGQTGDLPILQFEALDDEYILSREGVEVAEKLRNYHIALNLVIVKSLSKSEKTIQKVLALAAQHLISAVLCIPGEGALALRHVHGSDCSVYLSLPLLKRARLDQQHLNLDSGDTVSVSNGFFQEQNQLRICMKESPYDCDSLHHYVLHNDIDGLRKILLNRESVDINAKDEAGWTALNLAILLGRSEPVKMLLDYGANTASDIAQNLPAFVCGGWDSNLLTELSPLILSVRLNLKEIVEMLTKENPNNPDMTICIKMSYGMEVESALLAAVCKEAEQKYGTRFKPTYTAAHLNESIQRVCLGFSDKVCNVEKKEDIRGVQIVIMNLDISQESSWVKNEGILTKDEEVICTSIIDKWAEDLWEQHPNLNAITAGSIVSVKYPERKPSGHIILHCSHKGFIPLESKPFPVKLECEYGTMPVAVLEGKFKFSPLSRSSKPQHSSQNVASNTSSNTTDINDKANSSETHPMTTSKHLSLKIGMHLSKCCTSNDSQRYEGTLGTFVDMGNGKTGFITCAHLLYKEEILSDDKPIYFTSSPNKCGDDVIAPFDHFEEIFWRGVSDMEVDNQPGHEDGENIENRNAYWECGKVVRAVFDTTLETGIDAALVEIDPVRVPRDGSFDYISRTHRRESEMSQSPSFTSGKQADENYLASWCQGQPIRCMKLGASTGLTVGLLTWKNGQIRTDCASLGLEPDSTKKHIMKGQYVISDFKDVQFFRRGDSGSAVFVMKESDGPNSAYYPDACLGIAIGFLDKKTFVTPIGSILEKLKSDNAQALVLKTFT